MGKQQGDGSILSTFHYERDEQYEKAREFVLSQKSISATQLFKHFRISFVRSVKYIEMLEEDRVIAAGELTAPREVLKRT